MAKVAAFSALLLFIVVVLWKGNSIWTRYVTVTGPSPTISVNTKPAIPEGWKLVENKIPGITFAVPQDFTVEKYSEYSILADLPTPKYATGNTRFFYISVVPTAINDNEATRVYNYNKEFLNKLLGMNVGETKNFSDIESLKDSFYYERHADSIFNGKKAKVFANKHPWDLPDGTWEYQYIFELRGKTVIAVAYFAASPSDEPFTLTEVTKIMNTLSIKE